ncbi:glycosyltransferase family protein [Pseudidiomarina tainanensis]|uniref:hypothetical protein n=1 Tax=Pseudidiomarina tainanensis TaxID=502365 RepID=UPI001029F360|nr:hypothetical protein [Pseudidiomarina tainanensis]
MEIKFHIDERMAGKPSYSRLLSFKNYFEELESTRNLSLNQKIFVSMPPFRNFYKFFCLRKRIILDIRDGWSIAQATGYGGNVRRKPIKAWVSRKVEWFLIQRSYLTITCTPGLQRHLESVSGRNIIMIPNGISDERINLIKRLKKSKITAHGNSIRKRLTFVCAGQFSEYGVNKVKKLLKVISERYGDQPNLVRLIGADPKRNDWLVNYYKNLTNGFGEVDILPRMEEEEMYQHMLDADYGLTIIRDPDYDFGTKVYDYIALGLPYAKVTPITSSDSRLLFGST